MSFIPAPATMRLTIYKSPKQIHARMYQEKGLVNEFFRYTGPISITNQVSRYIHVSTGTEDPYLTYKVRV